MAKNTNLRNAKKAKNDEFFTQLSDIEREISHYDNAYFKGKVVLCNCNDGTDSKFWEYFHKNFKFKGLKKLIGISYALQEDTENRGKVYIYEGGTTADSDMDLNICVEKELKGSGDFREEECIDYLKEADVVVTNPPFSLFREYVAQLIEYNKKFVIIGNKNAITYKEIFPLLKQNKMWIGYKAMSGSLWFTTPEGFSKKSDKIVDGIKLTAVSCCWYTNLDIQKRHETLRLYRNYTPEDYPTYDNYNAINVDKTANIPMDYDGIMGVPITFLDKYNPEQFEILGIADRQNTSGLRIKKYTVDDSPKYNDLNSGSVIKMKQGYKLLYARLLIRRKN